MNVLTDKEVIRILTQLSNILDAYEKGIPLVANQSQALDGFSALANFLDVARKAKNLLIKEMPAE
jgi:hypothetical protein